MAGTDHAAERKDATLKMATLSEALNHAVKQGFDEDFKFENGMLSSQQTDGRYAPDDVRISNFYRFEGYSDPDENAILYLIETSDGKKGTLVDAYGAYSDAKLAGFIRAVEDITKK